jgi:hypothetical protein
VNHLYRRSQARKIAPGKAQLESGAADVFGPGGGNAAAQPAVVGSRVPWGWRPASVTRSELLIEQVNKWREIATKTAMDSEKTPTNGRPIVLIGR